MPYIYELTEKAAIEYEEAFIWYKGQSIIAADKLVIAFAEAIKLICKNPQQFRNPYKDFRELSLKKFPYKIIYIIEEPAKCVIIISLFHHKRHPLKKFRK